MSGNTNAPWRDEATLRQKYWDEGKTLAELADCFDTTVYHIRKAFDDLGVEKRGRSGSNPNAKYRDKSWLRQEYVDNRRSMADIGDELGVYSNTISYWVEKHGLEKHGSDPYVDEDYRDKDTLHELYINQGLPASEIGERLGVAGWTILRWLRKHGIEVRPKNREIPRFFTRRKGYEVIRSIEDGELVEVQLHRLIAVAEGKLSPEELSGRDKHVHHTTGIPWDNRPDKLEVLTASEHRKIHANE